jgi:hypothetical protein
LAQWSGHLAEVRRGNPTLLATDHPWAPDHCRLRSPKRAMEQRRSAAYHGVLPPWLNNATAWTICASDTARRRVAAVACLT